MSKIISTKIICAHCGRESEHYILLSSSSFGAMDLDTRPAAPARHNLQYEVQECPHCHYCNDNIGNSEIKGKSLPSDYLELANNDLIDGSVKKFLLSAKLQEEEFNYLRAGISYLKAAWTCDDNGDASSAVAYRKASAKCLLEHVNNTDDGDIAVMLVDVMRRSWQFKEALALIDRIGQTGDETLDSLLSYQCSLINNKDVSCHNMEEVS